ncbi:Pentatricopeptide repeat-containing protein mitochondrial [Zea mays]|uniref:Pentatricopeptide repeat-containing protein mitochondrial n=1 Tax=Zea mays TaxID=4577 RepID=A0A1D6GEN5_MAIZE|nr:Pentatricopeptide repeat-containing protein mitochondrial [Zea mays]
MLYLYPGFHFHSHRTWSGRVAYLGTLYSGYSSATLAAKSLQWEMDWAQMCLPDAAGLSNTRICAMAASCTCTAPIQMSLYSSVQPATTNRPASILYFLLHY